MNQPEAAVAALKGYWLHSGDLARQNEDGCLLIVDRKKELIIRGGYNVHHREIEEILYAHPAARETAVIGALHQDLGEEISAVAAIRPGAEVSRDQLRRFGKDKVTPYEHPPFD